MASVTTSSRARAPARRTQEERSAATRAALIGSARQLFADEGFAATGLDQVVGRSGLTRGALYHHFETKVDLFAAVVDQLDEELYAAVLAAAAKATDTAAAIRLGIRAYVVASAGSGARRIFADVASVLGPDAYQRLSAARCLPLVELAVATAAGEGLPLPGSPAVLAAMLLGALNEAVLVLARHPQSRSQRRAVLETVDGMVDRLLGDR